MDTSPPAHAPEDRPTAKGLRRVWIPLTLATVAALFLLGVALLPEQFDGGTRLIFSILGLALAGVGMLAWFFTMAGVSATSRLVVAGAGVLTLLAALALIRRVEFSGDMVPTFDFRWNADRDLVLEAHRTATKGDTPAADIEGKPSNTIDLLDYRGERRDGISDGPRLARDWSKQPPKLVWRQPVGGGYASFVVMGSLVITIEQRRDKEAVVAYDFDTGRERWIYDYPALFSEKLGGDGPRATPTIASGKLYSLGATGVLNCLDPLTGTLHWSANILELDAVKNLEWGMSGSPLVIDGVVIVNPGNQKGNSTSRALLGLDANDGKLRWAASDGIAGYASPMLATIDGVQQVLLFDGVGLSGHDPSDGRQLWQSPWKSQFDINAVQPAVVGDKQIIITSADGALLVEATHGAEGWNAREVWRNRKLKSSYSCPIVYQGHVYGIDENIFTCLELETGKQRWKDRAGQYGHGQMLLRHDLFVVLAESGELALVEATPERFHELGRIQAIEGKTWNNPALIGNRIFVRNHLEMAAYDLPTE